MRLLSSSLPMRTLLLSDQKPRPLPEPLALEPATGYLTFSHSAINRLNNSK